MKRHGPCEDTDGTREMVKVFRKKKKSGNMARVFRMFLTIGWYTVSMYEDLHGCLTRFCSYAFAGLYSSGRGWQRSKFIGAYAKQMFSGDSCSALKGCSHFSKFSISLS